jgi:hypothetical protein
MLSNFFVFFTKKSKWRQDKKGPGKRQKSRDPATDSMAQRPDFEKQPLYRIPAQPSTPA